MPRVQTERKGENETGLHGITGIDAVFFLASACRGALWTQPKGRVSPDAFKAISFPSIQVPATAAEFPPVFQAAAWVICSAATATGISLA